MPSHFPIAALGPALEFQLEGLLLAFTEGESCRLYAELLQEVGVEHLERRHVRQREMMLKVVAGSDVVITTALIPGKRAPILVTAEMVDGMAPGSVVVDLAAERGGNCELTRPDEVVVHRGVTILGPSNPPALVPNHASQMYSRNITTFLAHLLGKEGATKTALEIDPADEITRETLLARDGEVVHARVKDLLATGARA